MGRANGLLTSVQVGSEEDKNHAPVTREKENSILVSFLMSVEKAGVE